MKRLMLLVPIALMASVATGASSSQAQTYIPKAVNIIGDSITALASSELYEHLTIPGVIHYIPNISGRGGTTIAQNQAIIEADNVNATPDWVIELGTNDALSGDSNWWTDFNAEVSALDNERCVILITVGTQLPRGNDIAGAINFSIYDQTLFHSNFYELDWGNIEYNEARWLMSDHIHPTASGADELGMLVHEALNRDCMK